MTFTTGCILLADNYGARAKKLYVISIMMAYIGGGCKVHGVSIIAMSSIHGETKFKFRANQCSR